MVKRQTEAEYDSRRDSRHRHNGTWVTRSGHFVTNFNDDAWLGSDGYFHSEKMRVVERLTRKGDVLTYTATVDDPEVLAKPWTMTPRELKLSTNRSDALLEAPPCVEHDAPHIMTLDHH